MIRRPRETADKSPMTTRRGRNGRVRRPGGKGARDMRKMSYLVAGVVWVASTAGLAGGEPQVTQAHGVPRSGLVAPQAGKLGPSAAPALNGAAEDPCAALTPAAIQAAIDRMDQARAEAQLEYDAFSAGAYPAATSQGLAYITEAMGQMVFLQ